MSPLARALGRQQLERGLLPSPDPLDQFPDDSRYSGLDRLGRDLPSLLLEKDCRSYLREQAIPHWAGEPVTAGLLPQLQLYYVRLGFLASGYVNQIGQPPAHSLPANIAVPLVEACRLLQKPPILSYDGYALYNWKRFRTDRPIALGNIDTIQNFVHLYDEHWFILVHVEIEALAADILTAIAAIDRSLHGDTGVAISTCLADIASTMRRIAQVLQRIPERMSPELYYRTFRPYIRFFEDVTYEGVPQPAISFRGETGAQSSIVPLLVALMKIPHRRSALTDHLADMRHYMPAQHRFLLNEVEKLPDLRPLAGASEFNEVLESIAEFREIHYGWAKQYIDQWVADPRGTGGTPYMRWLRQLIDETRAHRQ